MRRVSHKYDMDFHVHVVLFYISPLRISTSERYGALTLMAGAMIIFLKFTCRSVTMCKIINQKVLIN